MMNTARLLRHVFAPPLAFGQVWTPAALQSIKQAVAASEQTHTAQLRFCVEERLPLSYLRRDATVRERAINMFSKLRIWDTEANNGVLIYALHVERRVELVADRGAARVIAQPQWDAWVADLQADYRKADFASGTVALIGRIGAELARHFPASPDHASKNELPDDAVVIRG
jgi:uncharacterized membrane protein